MRRFFRAMQTPALITGWLQMSREDGVITLAEMAALLQQVGEIWGIKELETLEVRLPEGKSDTLGALSGDLQPTQR